jgi:hypothetical protein
METLLLLPEWLLKILDWLLANWDSVVFIYIPAVVGFAAIIARWTPTEADDRVVAWVYENIHKIGQNKPLLEKLRKK